MGNTNISEIGKIFAVNTETAAANTKNDSSNAKVSFGAMMNQVGNNASQLSNQAASQAKNQVGNLSQDTAKTSTDEYAKYQYKDNNIEKQPENVYETDVVTEKVNEYAEDVKNILKEELGVTDEQIESAMETLGLEYVDLLNQNNLANLVAELTGTENVNQLLCNEQFMSVLQGVNELGKNLMDTLGMNAESIQMTVKNVDVSDTEVLPSEDVNTVETLPQGSAETTTSDAETEMAKDANLTLAAGSEMAEQTTQSKQVTSQVTNASDAETTMEEQTTVVPETTEQTTDSGEDDSSFMNQNSSGDSKNKFQFQNDTPVNAGEHVTMNQNTVVEQFAGVETVETVPEYVNVSDMIDQIVESAKVVLNHNSTTMEMQLNPENLGKILLQVTEKEGAVTAKIQTQNEIVKEALEAQVADLKQNMNQAGIKVDAVEVTIASHEFERNLEQDARGEEQQGENEERQMKQTRKLNLNDLDSLSGIMTEEETLVAKMMAEQGNSVDYTA